MKKLKVLSVLMPLFAMSLVGCGEKGETETNGKFESDATNHWKLAEDGSKVDKAKHTFVEDTSKGKAATCSKEGEKVEVCSVCGYEKTSKVSKLDHTYVEDTAASQAATCSKEGKKIEKCSVCGDVKESAISKVAHTYVEDTSAYVAPTCGATGKKVEKCSVCDDVKETTLDKTAHTLGAGTAKTDDKGREYTEFECSVCHQTVSTKIAFNTYELITGTFDAGKISKDPVGEIGWTFQLPAGNYDVFFEVKFSSSSSAANRTFASRKVVVSYNGSNLEYDNTKTPEDVGMTSSAYKSCTFFTITATGGVDKMTMQNPDYRLVFDVDGYIVFKPVATVS